MRVPANLMAFLAAAGVFYLAILPKRAAFTGDLLRAFKAGPRTARDSAETAVRARILADVCPRADLSEYRPGAFADYYRDGDGQVSIVHRFACDGENREFLFRIRGGIVNDIIDMR